jgi:hypothetical protein
MQATVIKLLLTAVLGALKAAPATAFNFIVDQFFNLFSPVSLATKAGVALAVIAGVVYLAVFHAETPLERTVLLASTIGSLVAGYILGDKT